VGHFNVVGRDWRGTLRKFEMKSVDIYMGVVSGATIKRTTNLGNS